jgi:DNA-3-methyladenine glycosylase II
LKALPSPSDTHLRIGESRNSKQRSKKIMLTFELSPTAPFRLDLTAWALRRRPENQIDRWDGTTYRRVICVRGRVAELRVRQPELRGAPRLEVTVSGARLGAAVKADVEMLLTGMLGLQIDLKPFYRMAARDAKLRQLAERYRGLKPVQFPTVFEALGNAFACQQFTIAAGLQLLNRLAKLGSVVIEASDGQFWGFPEPSDLARLSPLVFRRLGFSGQKTRAFRELSRGMVSRALDLGPLLQETNEAAISSLLSLRGVGRWTAEYVLLRGLGRLDVFPGDDVGARNRLAQWLHRSRPMNYASVRRVLNCWQPYAGLIYFHMLMESLSARGSITPE